MGFYGVIKKLLKSSQERNTTDRQKHLPKDAYLSKSLKKNTYYIKDLLKGSSDIIYRDLYIGQSQVQITLIFVDGMVEKATINEQILKPLMIEINKFDYTEGLWIEEIKKRLITASEVKTADTFDDVVLDLLSGDTIMFIDGLNAALIIGTKGWESRGSEEPASEQSVRGPRDGFIETLKNNMVLIRRRIKDPNLTMELHKLGTRTKTDVSVVYIKGVINERIVNEIRDRISRIRIDGVIESGQLEQLIQDHNWTIFPQIMATERPDKVVAALLEGRAAILIDGTPFALIVPTTISAFISSVDDYYERAIVSSVIRITRYISFFISSSLPALYVAIVSFHPGMLPSNLALSITASRVGLPFPAFLETIIMEFVLEILQEAGVRLPKPVGQTVSIVGGLVIGQSAVQAGLVSPIIVIVVALTAVSSFSLPNYSFGLATRIIRVPLIAAASFLGLYGLIIAWLVILFHLASLQSFGVGYLEEFSPYRPRDLKDIIFRVPTGYMRKRPEFLIPEDTQRQVHINESAK
jgi:hypothetical protein